MKTKQKGFIIPLLIVVIAVVAIGGGTYVYSQNKKLKSNAEITTEVKTETNAKTENTANQNSNSTTEVSSNTNIAVETKVSAKTPHLISVREYESEEPNVIHSDTKTRVTVRADNLPVCQKSTNCELVVYLGGKSFEIMTPSVETSFNFIPTRFENGTYDLYIYNRATGVKSNTIKVKVSNLLNAAINPLYPRGGETFKIGQKVTINWETNPVVTNLNPTGNFAGVSIQVVAGKLGDPCSSYTNSGSMGSCRAYEIYNGPNTGFFEWTVPSNYPGTGKYMIRIMPDVGTVVARSISDKGVDLVSYSGFFNIIR